MSYQTFFFITTNVKTYYNDPFIADISGGSRITGTNFIVPLSEQIQSLGFSVYDSSDVAIDLSNDTNAFFTSLDWTGPITMFSFLYTDDQNAQQTYQDDAFSYVGYSHPTQGTVQVFTSEGLLSTTFNNTINTDIGTIPRKLFFNGNSYGSGNFNFNYFQNNTTNMPDTGNMFSDTFTLQYGAATLTAVNPAITYTASSGTFNLTPQLKIELFSEPTKTSAFTGSLTNTQLGNFYRVTDGSATYSPNTSYYTSSLGKIQFPISVTLTSTVTKTYNIASNNTLLSGGSPTIVFTYVAGGGGGGGAPCFFGDVEVLTLQGYKPISSLKKDELIITQKGTKPIKKVLSYQVPASSHTNPFLIPKGMFGARKNLLISPDHCVLTQGKMIAAKNLGLEQQEKEGTLEYWNIELDDWLNMYVENVEVETLAPIQFITITKEQFNLMVQQQCQGIPDLEKIINEKCKFIGNNVEVPIHRRA